jgi:hypothetical protein
MMQPSRGGGSDAAKPRRRARVPEAERLREADEILALQVRAVLKRSGCSLRDAMGAVLRTYAGRELRKLRDGPHAREKARDWQQDLLWERALERLEEMVGSDAVAMWRFSVPRRYSWLDGYPERLEGNEARTGYCELPGEVPLPAGKVRSR